MSADDHPYRSCNDKVSSMRLDFKHWTKICSTRAGDTSVLSFENKIEFYISKADGDFYKILDIFY